MFFAVCFSVPGEDPSGKSMILPRDQFYRILQASRIQTKEEKLAEAERAKQEKLAALVSATELEKFFFFFALFL
jgi:hypothetical protein